jgi:ABC-type Mn2+/Zn2+ transport system permease subunit
MFHRYIMEVTQKTPQDQHTKEEFSYLIACAIGSTIGVLHKWIHENFRVSMEVIANIMTQAFMSGILPFISKEAARQPEPPAF